METNIQRYNKAQAKSMARDRGGGVDDVYRDGKGGVWMDQDEEWEYAGLLGGNDDGEDSQWVEFSGNSSRVSAAIGIDLAAEERRASISTQDSDLDPRFVVGEQDDLPSFEGPFRPFVHRKPHIFTIPPRTIRNENRHMQKPEFWPNGNPHAAPSHGGYLPPSSRGADRRRPAPLAWTSPPQPQRGMSSPFDTDTVRRDFLDGSFQPEPSMASPYGSSTTIHGRRRGSVASVLQPTNMTNSSQSPRGMSKKPSRLNMKGFFKAVGGTRR
jgi:hypothetical protein